MDSYGKFPIRIELFHIFEAMLKYILFTFGTGYRVRNVKSIWYTAYCTDDVVFSFPSID